MDSLLPECKTLMFVNHVSFFTHVHNQKVVGVLVILLVAYYNFFTAPFLI